MVLNAQHRRFPNLLEVSARPWLYELGVKRLSDVPDTVLEGYKAKGIDSFYLLGVWSIGQAGITHDRTDKGLLESYKQVLPDFTMDDVIGCPFAVVDYTVNEGEIATEQEMRDFRARLNAMGIMLYLDFVPNHSAIDSVQAENDIDLFVHSSNVDPSQQTPSGIFFGKDKFNNVWTDTAQYNYFNPATVEARIRDIMTVASLADGTRCDMAMLALNSDVDEIWGNLVRSQGYTRPSEEFWVRAIREVKAKYPNFKFMAEVYWKQEELIAAGFDYVYDKTGLYDQLSTRNLNNIRNYILGIGSRINIGTHFVENHDEGRAAAHFGENWIADAAGLATFTLPGMRFHFQGQWEGRKNKQEIHLRRSYQPETDLDQATIDMYNNFLPLMADPVWHEGVWQYMNVQGTSDCWRLLAWTWETDEQSVLVVVNFSEQKASGAVRLDVPNGDMIFTEKFTGEEYLRSGQEVRESGLFVIVESWSAQIFYYNY